MKMHELLTEEANEQAKEYPGHSWKWHYGTVVKDATIIRPGDKVLCEILGCVNCGEWIIMKEAKPDSYFLGPGPHLQGSFKNSDITESCDVKIMKAVLE